VKKAGALNVPAEDLGLMKRPRGGSPQGHMFMGANRRSCNVGVVLDVHSD
jgi:hypothetical protein